MRIGNLKNFASGLLFIALGIAVAVAASNYQVGTAARMGPGYFPLGVGIALCLTGAVVVLAELRSAAPQVGLGEWHLRRAAIVLGAVILFGVTVEPGGLVVAVPLLVGVASLAHPERSWRTILASIALLLPLTWLLFVWLLGLQFPLLPLFART